MKPNDLGKKAGLTKRDGDDLMRAERKLKDAVDLINALAETTGRACEDDEDCKTLLKSAAAIRERFFTIEGEE